MNIRVQAATAGEVATPLSDIDAAPADAEWVWVDIEVGADEAAELVAYTSQLELDAFAVRDAVEDFDLPKIDDFGSSLLAVFHGLADGRLRTYEIDCFLTERHVVTVRRVASPSVDVLWEAMQERPELSGGGPDELLARLADVLTRRLLSVLDEFDNRSEELVLDALRAAPTLIGEVTAVRSDLAVLRRAVGPQREAVDLLRHSNSPLLGPAARRRFSDVFDVASRAVSGVDAARTALAEVLDAYRGAEARAATEVSKVLTVYAAIMLPLSLIAGFFGMNFENLPGVDNENGWVIVTIAMAVVGVVSLGMFVALGWIRRPSGRDAGEALGRGLVEAARAPAQIVGAVFEISTMPLRSATGRVKRSDEAPGTR